MKTQNSIPTATCPKTMAWRLKTACAVRLLALLMLLAVPAAQAQFTFTTLHNFPGYTDGGHVVGNPEAGLILSGNTLYGTTQYGGVFAVNTNGTGYTNLHIFTGGIYDGDYAQAGMILSGNTLYGTTQYGGYWGVGAVFAVNTDGTGYTNLYSFTELDNDTYTTNSDGIWPYAGLVLSGNKLYGTASLGGSSGNGTVFAVNTDGTGFTNLHNFTASRANSSGDYTNSDGAWPYAGLVLSGNKLFGTASGGGFFACGTVFAVNTDGTGFTNLHSLRAYYGNPNNDGTLPVAGLILSGNTLYGTAQYGGSSGNGTVFAINTNGTGYTNLHRFTATSGPFPYTNSDGGEPVAGLILSGNTLYGTTMNGGSSGYGVVFKVNTDGTGFTNLYSFTASHTNSLGYYTNSDGAYPEAGLILSGNTLYGTTSEGGSSGYGTVFSLSLVGVSAPPLTIIRSGANVVLTWPTNAAGFTLQSNTNLVSPATWNTVSPAPVVVNGQNIVTNPISGTQQFYRLSQ